MGLRAGAYANIWEVRPISDTMTKARISISRKDKNTGTYVQDFGGFVVFVGTLAAKKAANLKERDRIKIGDIDISNRYDREKGVEYTDFKIFSFEMADEVDGGRQSPPPTKQTQFNADDGVLMDDTCPF